MLGGDIPYKGALDENVPVGNADVFADGPADCLVPEAEWCICFPGETDRFAADPSALAESTPIVMQGMIEGKWLNRIGEDLVWKPASLGNNLLAQGPGIAGTLGRLEDGGMQGEIGVQYTCRAGRQTLTAALADLRGHNLLGLVRAVFGHCRGQQLTVEAVDCSARGPASALAEDRRFHLPAAGKTYVPDLAGDVCLPAAGLRPDRPGCHTGRVHQRREISGNMPLTLSRMSGGRILRSAPGRSGLGSCGW